MILSDPKLFAEIQELVRQKLRSPGGAKPETPTDSPASETVSAGERASAPKVDLDIAVDDD